MLTLPSQRYIKLTSALSIDTGLSEQTLKYLEARATKLNRENTRSNGNVYGIKNGDPAKYCLL